MSDLEMLVEEFRNDLREIAKDKVDDFESHVREALEDIEGIKLDFEAPAWRELTNDYIETADSMLINIPTEEDLACSPYDTLEELYREHQQCEIDYFVEENYNSFNEYVLDERHDIRTQEQVLALLISKGVLNFSETFRLIDLLLGDDMLELVDFDVF